MMTDRERQLSDLIARVPVYMIDRQAARERGDLSALRYAKAVSAWLDEAAGLMAAQVSDLFASAEGGRVESRGAGEQEPHGEPSSELVSRGDFSPGSAA